MQLGWRPDDMAYAFSQVSAQPGLVADSEIMTAAVRECLQCHWCARTGLVTYLARFRATATGSDVTKSQVVDIRDESSAGLRLNVR